MWYFYAIGLTIVANTAFVNFSSYVDANVTLDANVKLMGILGWIIVAIAHSTTKIVKALETKKDGAESAESDKS